MQKSNLPVSEDKLSGDIYSLLLRQERILLKLKKEDRHLLNADAERTFLIACNYQLREELSGLTSIVNEIMPSCNCL